MKELKENTADLQAFVDFIEKHDLLQKSDTLAAVIDLLVKKEKMKKPAKESSKEEQP